MVSFTMICLQLNVSKHNQSFYKHGYISNLMYTIFMQELSILNERDYQRLEFICWLIDFCTANADSRHPSKLECVKASPARIMTGFSFSTTQPGWPVYPLCTWKTYIVNTCITMIIENCLTQAYYKCTNAVDGH